VVHVNLSLDKHLWRAFRIVCHQQKTSASKAIRLLLGKEVEYFVATRLSPPAIWPLPEQEELYRATMKEIADSLDDMQTIAATAITYEIAQKSEGSPCAAE